MTFKQLQESMSLFSQEQLDLDITVYDKTNSEYHPVLMWILTNENRSILDVGSPILVIKT